MAFPSNIKKPFLQHGFLALALHCQEAFTLLSNDDICTRLRKALRASYDKSDYWCYLISYFGDDQFGNVVYECDGAIKQAPYTCSQNGASIDIEKAINVYPVTTYVQATEAALREAGARNSASDLKQLQTIHDHSVALGASCKAAESAPASTAPLKLTEAAAFPVDIQLREAMGTGKKIKLIAPGKGSTAFYTAEMLKRDGPGVFKAGTPMRFDHPTPAEEAARPEGSVKDWKAVLATDAVYLDEAIAPAGEGLYSELKPFSDGVQTIEEKGPYAGVSISAWGEPLRENGKIVMREGVPVLAKLTSADGVDMVTRAGAGGMFLQEAARTANPNPGGDSEMDAAELKKLQENQTSLMVTNQRLLERALRGDAREEAVRILKGSSLVDAAKERVIEAALAQVIPATDGVLDTVKFKESVDLLAKREGEYVASLTGSGGVRGLGAPAPAAVVPIDAKEAERKAADQKKLRETAIRNFEEWGQTRAVAEASADRMLGVA